MTNDGSFPHSKINIDENFIWAKNEDSFYPAQIAGFTTTSISKRIRTTDKSKLGNKLLYRRNKVSQTTAKPYKKGDFNM